jgi:hypothetical protein
VVVLKKILFADSSGYSTGKDADIKIKINILGLKSRTV